MDKRYQIFVSSTFEDLKEERQAVLRAILELDHMPAGMELFPAADEEAWQLIKDVIDRSDYYVLIVGGRYGSLDEEGIGYTEKEYDYAVESGKPVLPLLHEDPDTLPRGQTETEDEAWDRLVAFREKIEENHTCKYWSNGDDLKARVIVGLTMATKRSPGVGWIRADEIPEGANPETVLELKTQIAELEAELEADRSRPPPGTERFAQGADLFKMSAAVALVPPGGSKWNADQYRVTIDPTWNELFGAVAPTLINEAKEEQVREALKSRLQSLAASKWRGLEDTPEGKISDITFRREDLDTVLVQFRALGLIRESVKKRSVKDTSTYWTLTGYGDNMLVKLRAVPRMPSSDEVDGEDDVP